MAPSCKVGNCVFRNIEFLKKLSKIKSENKRNLLLKNATPDELASLIEICYNVVNSNLRLSPSRILKLRPYATPLRELSKIRTVPRARKMLQTGNGFLPSLLIPVLLEASRILLK
uniref:Uncharacterized protein n=1 Tax=Panagrolaimus davidi TaxID=227884 RepID=A0A914QLQ1_9BILA